MDTTELEQVSDTCTNKPSSKDMAAHGNAIAQDNNRQPTNQEVIELSMGLSGGTRQSFFIELFGNAREFDTAKEQNRLLEDQNIDLFFRWKNINGQGATVQHIINAMDRVQDLDPHLREVFGRDRTLVIYQHEGGDRVPHDNEINQLCGKIGTHQKALFILLGLSPDDVERHKDENKQGVKDEIFAMFKQWKNQRSKEATINRIMDAMSVVRMDTETAEKVFFPESDSIL